MALYFMHENMYIYKRLLFKFSNQSTVINSIKILQYRLQYVLQYDLHYNKNFEETELQLIYMGPNPTSL